ncbi:MAG: hypothetical protein R3F17_08010 [Planctomycetota bacterium]
MMNKLYPLVLCTFLCSCATSLSESRARMSVVQPMGGVAAAMKTHGPIKESHAKAYRSPSRGPRVG